MDATDLILERFPSLSPTMQHAARFIVDHPNDVVIGSMRALAERAGTPSADATDVAHHRSAPVNGTSHRLPRDCRAGPQPVLAYPQGVGILDARILLEGEASSAQH
jgi:hypothetical protein